MASSSYCGIDCAACPSRQQVNCGACKAQGGVLFWGACSVAACAAAKELEDCGHCPDYPCAMLKEYAFDPVHGDGGERLANLCRAICSANPGCGRCCGGKCPMETAE